MLGGLYLHRPMAADQGFNWLESSGIRIFLPQGNRQHRVGMGEVWGKLMRGGVSEPEKNNPEMWRFFVPRCVCFQKAAHARQTLPQCFFLAPRLLLPHGLGATNPTIQAEHQKQPVHCNTATCTPICEGKYVSGGKPRRGSRGKATDTRQSTLDTETVNAKVAELVDTQ